MGKPYYGRQRTTIETLLMVSSAWPNHPDDRPRAPAAGRECPHGACSSHAWRRKNPSARFQRIGFGQAGMQSCQRLALLERRGNSAFSLFDAIFQLTIFGIHG